MAFPFAFMNHNIKNTLLVASVLTNVVFITLMIGDSQFVGQLIESETPMVGDEQITEEISVNSHEDFEASTDPVHSTEDSEAQHDPALSTAGHHPNVSALMCLPSTNLRTQGCTLRNSPRWAMTL